MNKFIVNLISSHTSSTKTILVGLLGWAGVSQAPGVQSHLREFLERHPRLTPIMWSITAIAFLLTQPKIQARIEAATGIDLAQEQAKLDESKEKISEVQKDMKAAAEQARQTLPTPKKK